MKIAIYTIALKSMVQMDRWANSAADADYRTVADSGSTDDTGEAPTIQVTTKEVGVTV